MSEKTGKEPANEKICRYCGNAIVKMRTPGRIGGRFYRWATALSNLFYCPNAGGDCWHEPAESIRKEQ